MKEMMHKRPVVICHKHQRETSDSKVFCHPCYSIMHLQTNVIKTDTNDILKLKAFTFCSLGGNKLSMGFVT